MSRTASNWVKFADSSLISLILTFFKKDSGIYLRIWRNLSQILKLMADNGPVTAVSRRELRRELGGSWRENVNVNWVKLNVNLVYIAQTLALHAVIFVKLAEPASVLLRRPLGASFRRRVRPCIIGCFSCEKGGQQLDCLPLSLPLAATHGEWAPRPTRK